MSAPIQLIDTFSRAGIQLALHLEGRDEPLFGDVVSPLYRGVFCFGVWGGPTLTLAIREVKSATSPDLKFAEYRLIRERQRAEFAVRGGGGCDGD